MALLAFQAGPWDPSHRFETSWCLSPYALFAARAFFALYAFVVQLFILAWDCRHASLGGCAAARLTFSYFTVLTYWGLAFYFLVAAVHTWTYARTGVALLDRLPRPLQALHAVFYSTIIVYPFIVTIIYWAVLYSGTWFTVTFSAWSNISQHGLNSFFALFEIVVPRTAPSPWLHIPCLIFLLALYLALAYLTHATKGVYVYSFLDPAEHGSGIVAAYVLGIAAGCAVIFTLVKGLVVLRVWLTETKHGRLGKFAAADTGAPRGRIDAEMGGFVPAKISST